MIEVHSVVKKMLGPKWVARDEAGVERWVTEKSELLPPLLKEIFREVVVEGRDPHAVAESHGIAWATVRGRVARGFEILGVLAKALPREEFNALFASIFEYQFGDEVTTPELTRALLGRYDRRSTQVVAGIWLPAAQAGKLDLPLPEKKGKSWTWTKEQAEAWRKWYAEREESIDVDEAVTEARE